MKLTKKVANPRCLSYNICNITVFSLSTRTRQRVLTFGGPRQEVVIKKNTVSRSRSARSRTTCPVSIRVGVALEDHACKDITVELHMTNRVRSKLLLGVNWSCARIKITHMCLLKNLGSIFRLRQEYARGSTRGEYTEKIVEWAKRVTIRCFEVGGSGGGRGRGVVVVSVLFVVLIVELEVLIVELFVDLFVVVFVEESRHDTSVECYYYETQGHVMTVCELQRHHGGQDVDAKGNGYCEIIWIKINGAFIVSGYGLRRYVGDLLTERKYARAVGAGVLRTLKLDMKSANNGHVYSTDIITVDQGRCKKWEVVIKKNTVSRSRSARSRTNCPVSIRVETARLRTVRMVAGLTTWLNVSSQSMPYFLLRPLATSRALYRFKDPFALYFSLYNHIEWKMLTFGGRGTSTKEEVVTCKLYLGLAFTISTLKRVTIRCCEVGGSGGGRGRGVVGGVGVVCGVDSGVGGADCGVVCGFVCGGVCWGK
nr:hypothetical protein [Tanacetum cinerariifolium]